MSALTPRQIEVLQSAHKAHNGWLERGACRIWGIAPQAVMACKRKGLLEMHGEGRARLTAAGRAMVEGAQS